MTKTAEQFDAEVDAINERLSVGLKPVFKAFYDDLTSLAKEMEQSDVPMHLQSAIATKGLQGMEAAIDAIGQEIGS